MANLTKIAFAGSYKCDLILYMARIAHVLGKKVMIVDSSDEQLLVFCIPNYLNNKVITYENADFYLGCNTLETFEKLPFDKYDLALLDFGFNKSLIDAFQKSDRNILITDMERHNVLRLKDFMSALMVSEHKTAESKANETEIVEAVNRKTNKEMVNFTRIYRDIVDSKINTKYIDTVLDISANINITSQYLMYFDDTDYKVRIESQYDDCFRFHKLSKVYKIMFSEVIGEYLNIPKKDVDKAIHRAEKGV